MVNGVYDLFLERVAKARNLPKAKVADIAQGRVWSGQDARNLGLVDELGGLESALQYAVTAAKLPEGDWSLEEYPQNQSLEDIVLTKLLNSSVKWSSQAPDPLTLEFLKLKKDLSIFEGLNDPQGIYARMTFNGEFR
jgi:protease-4